MANELIKDKEKKLIEKQFSVLEGDVRILMFTQEIECQLCAMTRQLIEELSALSDKISLEVKDFVADAELAKQYGVDKIPAIVLMGEKDYGIRFYGIPGGYEFATLLEDIRDVSLRDPGLSDEVKALLEQVDKPVHMQAMVTPTCPYCPQAVRTAHRFAMASEFITGDMVEVTEFPHLANKYRVSGVPNTIVNEAHSIMGAQPELMAAKAVLAAIGK